MGSKLCFRSVSNCAGVLLGSGKSNQVDGHEKKVLVELGHGPRTAWWIDQALGTNQATIVLRVLRNRGFVEERGDEFLYPHVDRRTGERKVRGKKEYRFKGWTERRQYFALTPAGRALLPLNQIITGVIKE